MDISSLVHRTISIPSYFAAPVFIEDAEIEEAFIYLRVRTNAGQLTEITVTPEEIQQVLETTTTAQIEVVSGHEQSLLADDPGAGKTIMAGLLIKELKMRNAIERVLVLCPAPLTIQWQDELRSKFDEVFEVIRSQMAKDQLAGNVWQRFPQCITSVDLLSPNKHENYLHQQNLLDTYDDEQETDDADEFLNETAATRINDRIPMLQIVYLPLEWVNASDHLRDYLTDNLYANIALE